MTESTIEISNQTGLNARPVTLLVQTAGKFNSEIWVAKGEKKVNAKSIMGLMSLAISRGEIISIGAHGEDEETAVKELLELIKEGFGE